MYLNVIAVIELLRDAQEVLSTLKEDSIINIDFDMSMVNDKNICSLSNRCRDTRINAAKRSTGIINNLKEFDEENKE